MTSSVGYDEQDRAEMSRTGTPSRAPEELPYWIELWHTERPDTVERVLARAANAQLARAIFNAAKGEYPDRRITLRKNSRITADSLG
jgi:hypothetical protein